MTINGSRHVSLREHGIILSIWTMDVAFVFFEYVPPLCLRKAETGCCCGGTETFWLLLLLLLRTTPPSTSLLFCLNLDCLCDSPSLLSITRFIVSPEEDVYANRISGYIGMMRCTYCDRSSNKTNNCRVRTIHFSPGTGNTRIFCRCTEF